MVTNHYSFLPCSVDWMAVVDDFGNLIKDPVSVKAWWNAYRFANGQSFEQANMRSIGCMVAEH